MDQLSPIPYSLFLITLNYSSSNILPFTFRVKDGEICSQSHSVEYGWLGPDLTQNKRGRYILILLMVLMTPNRMVCTGIKSGSNYPPLARRL